MPIKDILVLCDAGEANDYRVETAMSLAKVFDAHVTGVHLIPYPLIPVYGGIYPPYTDFSAAVQMDKTEELTQHLKEVFEKVATRLEVPYHWKTMEGIDVDYVIDNARYADIVITPQGYSRYGEYEPQRINDYFTTHLGRPLLVIPDLKKVFGLPKNVVVAWNESREATRAVHDALPLLETAENIQVVAVSKNEKEERRSMIVCDDLRNHLARHGVNVDVASPARSPKGVGETIMESALETEADLIVMGAYGHSRFKQIILGGVTRHMLDHATIPVLLSS